MPGMVKGIFSGDGIREDLEHILNKAGNISINNREVIIWGAGNTTELNKNTIMEEGLKPCLFIDNDIEKWEKEKWGIKIVSPGDINHYCINPVVLISSANAKTCREIMDQLIKLNIKEYYMLDEVVWGRHKEELLRVYDILETKDSKELFVTIITARIMGIEIPEECIKKEQYFALKDFKIRNPHEVFVDCGAYVGDTIEQYLYIKDGVFGEIYAFEPEKLNFSAIMKRSERLVNEWGILDNKIHIINAAIGKEDSKVYINNDRESMSAKITNVNTGNETKVCAIDSYLKDIDIGFIKADVEGYELDMILGGVKSIKRCKPILAICIYHQSSDLYKIPLLIKKIEEKYKLDIVHHYYNYNETVLYAY